MMSLLVPRKTVGFETPSVVPAAGDSDSESDGAEEAPGTILKKALTVSFEMRAPIPLRKFRERGCVCV